MSLEQKINYQLNKYPVVKKVIKRAYQRIMYAISPKIKSEGNIIRISPDDQNHEYFFGYYDKSPWDITDRYMLCLKAKNTWSDVSPKETAEILLIDTEKDENDKARVTKIAETRAWNVQQSCMLQWLGPDYSSRVIYNDYRDGRYVSVILNVATMEEKIIPAPVYSVSADGKFALSLDFSRLYNLRPGYGYYNVPERTKGVALPDETAIWKIDLEMGEVSSLLKYTDFANFQPRPEMQEVGSVHKVNHIMLSPNGKRFMVLYRWFIGERKYTRLVTCNVDGTDMYILSDDDMVSHCYWKNDDYIIAFENKKESGPGYYLMKDKTQEYVHCWPDLTGDGHPSFSPDRSLVVTDSYPDRARMASLKVMNADVEKNEVNVVAKVFAPFKYDNDTRCDLHPRWNHAGDKICFDSVFEGHRGMYIINLPLHERKNEDMTGHVKVLYITDTMKQRFGVTSVIMNFLSHWPESNVSIDIIAYENSESEMVEKAKEYGAKVFFMPYLLPKNIRSFIKFYHSFFAENHYDIVHSHFNQIDALVFPIARKYGVKKCISHSHNTKLSDYKLKAIRNRLMCLNITYNADYLAACSEMAGRALFGRSFSHRKNTLIIHNGIDCEKYLFSNENRRKIRSEFGIESDAVLIGHVGSFKPQKNQIFLVRVFSELFMKNTKYRLVLVGEGQTMNMVKEECYKLGIENNVIFTGARSDVDKILSALDIYILPSVYEGLGISAIEAQANGIPCVFSTAVPKEADLTGVLYLDLNEQSNVWANSIIKMDYSRHPEWNEMIKRKGFDITTEALKLSDFYIAHANM